MSEGECGISGVPSNDFDYILTPCDVFTHRVDIVSLNNMRITYNINTKCCIMFLFIIAPTCFGLNSWGHLQRARKFVRLLCKLAEVLQRAY